MVGRPKIVGRECEKEEEQQYKMVLKWDYLSFIFKYKSFSIIC